MKTNNIFFRSFLFAFLFPLSGLANEVILSQGKDTSLSESDYQSMAASELSAEQRTRMASDERELIDFVFSLHANLGVWKAAEQAELASRPDIARTLLRARQRILIDAYLKDFAQRLEWPDFTALAAQQYAVNPQRFKTAEKRKAAHILLKDTERTGCDCAARPTAEDLISRLAAGERFSELAKTYSDDPGSAAQGGELSRWTTPGQGVFVAPFETALFKLPELGAVSAPVKSKFGIHIIKLVGLEEERVKSFAEVKDKLISTLRAEFIKTKTNEMQASYYPDLKNVDLARIQRVIIQTDETGASNKN